MFPDDAACSAYLAQLRWSEGFVYQPAKQTLRPFLSEKRVIESKDISKYGDFGSDPKIKISRMEINQFDIGRKY